jgi:hypothetical protein
MMETPKPPTQITTLTSSAHNIKAFSSGEDAQPTVIFFLNRKDLAGLRWEEPSWEKELTRSIAAMRCFALPGLACHGILEDKEECYLHEIYTGFLFRKRRWGHQIVNDGQMVGLVL